MKTKTYIVKIVDDGSKASEESIRELECQWGAEEIEKRKDCVSREDATAKLFQSMIINSSEFGNELSPEEKKFNDGLRKAVEIIRNLPPVHSQPKSGMWKYHEGVRSCNECGAVVEETSPFCPMCGRDMRENSEKMND